MDFKSRVVNFKEKPYDVYIGPGSKWENPYSFFPSTNLKKPFICNNAREAVEKYISWFMKRPKLQKEAIQELKGKVLGDWLDSQQLSHGVFLIQFVERE